MKLTTTEADFLAHCVAMWADTVPVKPGVPLMFTDRTGEKVRLTSDQIYDLYDNLKANGTQRPFTN